MWHGEGKQESKIATVKDYDLLNNTPKASCQCIMKTKLSFCVKIFVRKKVIKNGSCVRKEDEVTQYHATHLLKSKRVVKIIQRMRLMECKYEKLSKRKIITKEISEDHIDDHKKFPKCETISLFPGSFKFFPHHLDLFITWIWG